MNGSIFLKLQIPSINYVANNQLNANELVNFDFGI